MGGNTAGMEPPPWEWWRSKLAAKFGVWPPSRIEDADMGEVAVEEAFVQLEAQFGDG